MNINIAVCDDDKVFCRLMKDKVQSDNWGNNTVITHGYTSGKLLIERIKNGTRYDVIFMDIEFKDDYLGMDTAMIIKMIIPSSLIIYMSSHDSYFKDMVRAEPFYFLKKPIDNTELQKAIELALNRLHYIYESYLYSYKASGVFNTVNLNDVKYFESSHRIIIIHLNNDSTFKFYKKLDDLQKEISEITPYFLRASKSFLINQKYITSFSSNTVYIINDDIEIHITDKYLNDFRLGYMKFKDIR